MRRTKRLLSTGTTEAPEREAPPAPSSLQPWALPEEASDVYMAPAAKRLKLPDKVLARLGRTSSSATEETGTVTTDAKDDDGGVAEIIRKKKLSAAEHHKMMSVSGANGDKRPLVSVPRVARHNYHNNNQRDELSPAREHFANSRDDVICFGTKESLNGNGDDGDSDASSSMSSWPSDGKSQADSKETDVRAARRRKEIDRHFSGYASDDLESPTDSVSEEEEEEEEEEKDADNNTNNNSNGDDVTVRATGESAGGFGLFRRRSEQQEQEKKTADVSDKTRINDLTNITTDRRYRYSSMFFEMHIGREGGAISCHHTLLCLNGPITVQGPCGIIGFGIGEVTIGGFYLGKKHMMLCSDAERAVVTPVQRLKSKASVLESLPVTLPMPSKESSNNDDSVTILPPTTTTTGVGVGDGGEDTEDYDDVEMFGTIDWVWVESTIKSWRGRFANNMPSVILIVQPYDPSGLPPTRRHHFKLKEQQSEDAYIDIPRFVARHHDCSIDAALLPDVIPAIVKQGPGAVVVVGSQNIGKSTLARFLANALFSQHGVCYWLDFDLGQPEFSPPGVFSLHRIQQPLLRPHDTKKVQLVKGFYLGGSRPRCAVSVAIAIEQLCNVVRPLQRRYPVVVNTHGWVLSTGRRVTVEAIQRLQPKHILHLVKEGESRWARDSELLMSPSMGLNTEVLHKRFIVHRTGVDNNNDDGKMKGSENSIGKFPYPYCTNNKQGKSVTAANGASNWCGTVHTVNVMRNDKDSNRHDKEMKPSAMRSAIWKQQLASIFSYYERLGTMRRGADDSLHVTAERDAHTTLLKGPLRQFDAIVLTDMEEARGMIRTDVVCAALEHRVVALSFSLVPAELSTEEKKEKEKEKEVNYRCLMEMPKGFSVSCFGVVESTEEEMRVTGEVKIRLPLHRDAVRCMLSTCIEDKRVGLSLACTLADSTDTAALEELF